VSDHPPAARGRFATTHWSLVLAAGQRSHSRSAEALATLCETYWYPVYAFIRRQGYDVDAARDLTQEFFTRVLEKNYFRDADPTRGRFRAFLLAANRHFLSNERDRARALKRGGAMPLVSLDVETAEGTYQLEGQDDLTPEKLFDARWATVLLDRALTRLRREYAGSKRGALFDQLKGFLTGDSADVPYAQAARGLEMTESAVKVAVHRLRRRFRAALVEEISHTVADPADIDAEIRHLLQAVSR
jgi:DNA-directed RNA polymerase specialized sigma24 family protein